MAKEKEKVNRRRQLIFRQVVLDNHPLSLSKLQELLLDDKYDEKTAQRDVHAFKDVGCKLRLQQCQSSENDKELVFLEGPHTDDDTTRENINSAEKGLVARLAASLICGTPDLTKEGIPPSWVSDDTAREALEKMCSTAKDKKMAARLRSFISLLNQKLKAHRGEFAIDSAQTVLKLFHRMGFSLERKEVLKASLFRFWETTSRLVAIDSGTTNIAIARFLKELPIPMVNSQLCSLTVCTNSRRIFQELGPSKVWVKTIIIGGQQKFRSPTIAGAMAELFLRSVSILQFGMCILGSTRIDIDRGVVCSDSQEESSIKNLLMERSSLRIVCVDDSKLQQGPGREGYRFASIDPKHIDLILTNCPLRKKGKGGEVEYGSFLEKIDSIESRGVPVLLAASPRTFGYSHNG